MSEFGHHYKNGRGFCIDSWGSGPFVMHVGDKTFRFTDSDRFGPLFVGKSGKELGNQFLAEREPFWEAHHKWVQQGRRVAMDGKTCVIKPRRSVP